MRLLKLPLKLLALPLMLALYTLHIIGKLASNLTAYVVGLFMLVVLACGIYQVCVRDWLNVAILFGDGWSVVCGAPVLCHAPGGTGRRVGRQPWGFPPLINL